MMPQHSYPRSKRFKKSWVLFGLLCASIIVFHKTLLLTGCKIALNRAIPKKEGRIVSYEKMQWEDGAIAISGFQVKDPDIEVTIDRIELTCAALSFRLQPKISMSHPQILISSASGRGTSSIPFLYRTRFIEPCWEIKNGVLQLPTGGRFYFSMSPGAAQESIGDFVFSSDPDPMAPPMFSANLSLIEEKLQMGFTLQESDLSRLLPVVSLIVQEAPRKWEQASGEIQLEGLLCFDRDFNLQELYCQGEGKQIMLIDRGCGVKDLEGHLCLDSKKEPELILNGNLIQQDREISFGCVGKGRVIQGTCGNFEGEMTYFGPQADHLADIVIRGDAKEILTLFSDQGSEKVASLPLSLHMTAKIHASQLHVDTLGNIAGESIQSSAIFSFSNLSLPKMLSGDLPRLLFKEAKVQTEHFTEKSYAAFLPFILPGIQLSGGLQGEATLLPSEVHLQFTGDEIFIQHPLAELHLPRVKERPIQFFYNSAHKQWRGEIPLDEGNLHYTENNLIFENLEGSMRLDADHLTASSFYAECEGVALRGDMDLFLENHEKGQMSLSTSQMAGTIQSLFLVLRHFPSLPTISFSTDGNFSSGDKGFVLSSPIGSSGNAEWSFKGNFNSLNFPVNGATSITDGHCDLVFDSKNQELLIDKGEGTWRLLDGMPFTVQLKRCSTQFLKMASLDFAFKIMEGKKEFAHFEGKAVQTDSSQWAIAFDKQKTYLGGTHLNIMECLLDEEMQLASFEMRPILKCQDLHTQAAFLQNAGFLSKAFSAKNLQDWQFEGTLQTRLYSEAADKGFSFHAESRDLKVRGRPWASFQLKAHKVGENWLIEHLEGGGLTLKGAFVVDGSELSVQHFEGKWQGIVCKGTGSLQTDQKTFSCKLESIKGDLPALPQWAPSAKALSLKGNFIASGFVSGDFSDLRDPLQLIGETNLFIDLQAPLAISANNRKTIPFTYDNANGLICNRIDVQFKDKTSGAYLAEFKADRLSWPQQENLAFEKLEFSLSPKMTDACIHAKILPVLFKDLRWEGNLEGSGDLQISSGPVFQATLKPGRYGFGDKDFPFEQLHMRYEKDLLTMRGKTNIEEMPLWGTLQVDLSKEPFGVCKFFDHPKSEGLKILFNTLAGKLIWERVQGCCYGIDCDLAKNKSRKIPSATILSGNLKLDCHSLSPLLPKEVREGLASLNIGSGYQWQGDLILWQEPKRGFQANGTLSGDEFEFLGYQFRRLQGVLDATQDRILITDLKIDDPAGMIGIKKFELNHNGKWHLYIPQILVRQLQPSLMHKIDADPHMVKPFIIKNCTFAEIRGKLGDKASLEGSGKLTFVNQFKKESSFLDLPLEMIKKIGLDPNLLTPVEGELEIELRGDKFYLMSLANSFSEGNRAEFYLAPGKEPSYIDLDGKIHIDLKMHQDVMLKITEPFTLTIRGTLEKPRYGLQY